MLTKPVDKSCFWAHRLPSLQWLERLQDHCENSAETIQAQAQPHDPLRSLSTLRFYNFF